MRVESYTLSTSQSLVTTARRYRSSTRRIHAGTPGWVLIFAHGAGMYKEYFDPLITRLFALDEQKECGGQIVEAWAIDAQTHGAAAELNGAVINKTGFQCSPVDYASAIAALRTSIFFGDADIQRVVLIGEREGAAAALYAPDFFSPDEPSPIDNIVLIDPFKASPRVNTNEWTTQESARVYLSNFIEPMQLNNYVNHALFRTETGSVRLRATLEHQEQLRNKKYLDWNSIVLPVSINVHLLVTERLSSKDISLYGNPMTSVTENSSAADGLYKVLTNTSRVVAERVFGVVRSRVEGKL